ncbi:hypothetical protein GCM10009557_61120 [Virgisporangium ochraceum]
MPQWVSGQAGRYHIRNLDNGLCLNVKGASKESSAEIIQSRVVVRMRSWCVTVRSDALSFAGFGCLLIVV